MVHFSYPVFWMSIEKKNLSGEVELLFTSYSHMSALLDLLAGQLHASYLTSL